MARRARWLLACALAAGLAGSAAGTEPGAEAEETAREGAIELAIEPLQATVGDPLRATLSLTLPETTTVVTEPLPTRLGPFVVEDPSWQAPEAATAGYRLWRWSGRLRAFRTGELEVPAVNVQIELGEGRRQTLATEPKTVSITSVLDPTESAAAEPPEIADLKPPASLAPDHTALWIATAILGALLVAAVVIWWLQRRFAASFAAVPSPADPFGRTPPHVWVYAELQKLLESRLAEQGHVDLFFAELARILKRYLSGRYRVELMEHTTEEVPRRLRQAGADERAVSSIVALLARCDRVKFAADKPDPPTCRRAIEDAYSIVDATKPQEEIPSEARGAA